MEAQKEKSMMYFKEMVLPRRCRDLAAEHNEREVSDRNITAYRKVLPDEEARGELFPVCSAGLKTFALFGIGIGIYYMQLLILCIISFLSGLIMIIAMIQYGSSNYGIQSSLNPLLPYTAACEEPEIIKNVPVDSCTGLEVCQNNQADLEYRPNCELPLYAVYSDLIMSIFFFIMILLSNYAESQLEEELDEAIQTAQDYSVVVNDPVKDADDPDEWYEFFSRFGTVRYVTITRKNHDLTELIVKRHKIQTTINELTFELQLNNNNEKIKKKLQNYHQKLEKIIKKCEKLYLKSYPIGRVYITFEYEEHQRLCLNEMEVPDLIAIFDISGYSKDRTLFRKSYVLDVIEPSEPDSILWKNLEISSKKHIFYIFLSYMLTLIVLVLLFVIVDSTYKISSLLLSLVIGIVDAILPLIFSFIIDLSKPLNEGQRQSDIQVRLFLARLLLSTGFPYYTTAWNSVLSIAFIQQIMIVQLSVSFISPLIQLLDIGGILTRHFIGPLTSSTQGDLNTKFNGSKWNLAEKYTGIAKILFLALFYTLLNPFSLFIAMIAFLVVFFIDRYLLLRRWEPCCMLDSTIAKRLRQQGMLAITAHLYISLRFIYSWPMDQIYKKSTNNNIEYVNKFPDFLIADYQIQKWHTSTQKHILPFYRIGFYIIAGITCYVWIIDPFINFLKRLLCYNINTVGDSQGIKFSQVEKILAYVPIIKYKNEIFLCSYIKNMLLKHRPKLLRPVPNDHDDLSYYIPIQHRPHILSIIKYYGENNDDDEEIKNNNEGINSNNDIEIGISLLESSTTTAAAAAMTATRGGGGGVIEDDNHGKKDSTTSTLELILQQSIDTQQLPKYTTDGENILHSHYNTLPKDLMNIIRGQSLPSTRRRDMTSMDETSVPAVIESNEIDQSSIHINNNNDDDDDDDDEQQQQLYQQYQQLEENQLKREINPIAMKPIIGSSNLPVDVAKAIGLPDPNEESEVKDKKLNRNERIASRQLNKMKSNRSFRNQRVIPYNPIPGSDAAAGERKENRVRLQPLSLI